MKRLTFCLLFSVALFSCAKKEQSVIPPAVITADETIAKSDSGTAGEFDSSKIQLSEKLKGTFPYLNPPTGYTFNTDGITEKNISDADTEYFAVDGKLIPIEGKTAKFTLNKSATNASKFNALVVSNSFDQQIAALGGILINNVAVPTSEIKRVGDAELITKHYGYSLDYNLLDQVKTYIIRTTDKEIWIQFFAMNEESGRMTVLEKTVPAKSSNAK